MKNMLFWVGGVCVAAAGIVVLLGAKNKAVDVLAQELEVAWADHHTVV